MKASLLFVNALILCLASVLGEKQPPKKDAHSKCMAWADDGECERNPKVCNGVHVEAKLFLFHLH